MNRQLATICILGALFLVMEAVFLTIPLGSLIWLLLALAAAGWFYAEFVTQKPKGVLVRKALLIGVFLTGFDFIVENSGWLLGYWHTQNAIIAIGIVPIAVMFVCLIGGAAWALYLPRKFNPTFTFADSLFFAVWGAVGEKVLMGQGLMLYTQGWTSYHAFAAYFITWLILHWAAYFSPLKMSK